jgi:hypothetical protein
VTLPAHKTGDGLLIVAAAKSDAITSVDPTIGGDWLRFSSFADGTANSGTGTGSVRQALFWKVATSDREPNPTVTWGASATPGICLPLAFSKAANDEWVTPVAVTIQTNAATSISVTMGSNPGITAGDWGLVIHTTRDDSALTVPSWSATGTTLAAVVEYPATAIATGDGGDMAGDCGYRSVTSGTASAAPVCTGTQAAAETGVTAFVRLRVSAQSPGTVTDYGSSSASGRASQMNQLLAS